MEIQAMSLPATLLLKCPEVLGCSQSIQPGEVAWNQYVK
jgi:hypothetical protein